MVESTLGLVTVFTRKPSITRVLGRNRSASGRGGGLKPRGFRQGGVLFFEGRNLSRESSKFKVGSRGFSNCILVVKFSDVRLQEIRAGDSVIKKGLEEERANRPTWALPISPIEPEY